MNYKPIVPGSPESSILIFGCAGLMGRIGRKESIQAVHRALERGISHFDVARSYGYGEAENCLGEALQGCRRKVVITGKFGIVASDRGKSLRFLLPMAQRVLLFFPAARKVLRQGVKSFGATAVGGQFDIDTSLKSVETSLRELRTYYIDLLLMHDCRAEDVTDGMVEFLENLRKSGKIRAYGASASIETAQEIESRYPGRFFFQVPNGVIHYAKNSWRPPGPFLSYGLLQGADRIQKWAADDQAGLRIVGLPIVTRQEVFEWMLQYGFSSNPLGSVVCSMLAPEHLAANLAVVQRPRLSQEQLDAFTGWVMSHVSRAELATGGTLG